MNYQMHFSCKKWTHTVSNESLYHVQQQNLKFGENDLICILLICINLLNVRAIKMHKLYA